MQETVIDLVVLGLLVFLFAAVARVRPDDRLRCWVAGWFSILAHFGIELWQPTAAPWLNVQASIVVDTLALAGIFFVASTMIQIEGRARALALWMAITIPTIVCLNFAIAGNAGIWLLSTVVVVRQLIAMFLSAQGRGNRPIVAAMRIIVCLIAGVWSLYGIQHRHPDLIVVALLAEIFLIAAIIFWNYGWQRTIALYTMIIGLIAWACVFPVGYLTQLLWPRLYVDGDFWNIPKLCVAAGMILVVIEEQMRAAHALTEEYRLLFAGNPRPMWILDVETMRFLDVNQSALEQHGYTRKEFLRLRLSDILHAEMAESIARRLAWSEPSPNRASRHIRKDGTDFPVDIEAHSIEFRGRKCRLVMASDVTEREALAQKLIDQSKLDALTGLANRLLFREQLGEAIKRIGAPGEKLAILCIDMQRFKRVNDVYGPQVGDQCIKSIAGILLSGVHAIDVVARTGGDEFTIVLSGIRSAVAAEQVANELRKALSQPLQVNDYRVQLSFSMGLAICPDDATDADALWRSAESALKQAQIAGGGQTVWQSPDTSQAVERQIEIEAYMRTALNEGRYHLVYQPFYGFDGQAHGMEALLRLDHPIYGAISPADVIPIAEETGLIVPLGQCVIEQVCRQLLLWRDQGMRMVPVALNLSVLQLMHVDFAERFVQTLEHYGVDRQWIHLELTETAAMRNLSEVTAQIAALSALGITFSLDDFGTGHSSLGRLHQLNLSVLKIDRSFISDLSRQKGTYSIVQAIVSMAHSLGHIVVAEGVETEDQLACLRELNCDLLQGYLLSRPVRPEQISAQMTVLHSKIKHPSRLPASAVLPFPEEAPVAAHAEPVASIA